MPDPAHHMCIARSVRPRSSTAAILQKCYHDHAGLFKVPTALKGSCAIGRPQNSENSKANRIETYERSRGIWTNLFGGSKKNREEKREKKTMLCQHLATPLQDAVERGGGGLW